MEFEAVSRKVMEIVNKATNRTNDLDLTSKIKSLGVTSLNFINASSFNIGMSMDAVEKDRQPCACVKCGKCKGVCPQNIDIPHALEELSDMLSKLPSWAEICKQRETEAKRKKA